MVLRKVVLSQIVIMMLASCGANSGGGGSSSSNQSNNISAKQFAHAVKKEDITPHVISLSLPSGIVDIDLSEQVKSSGAPEDHMPKIESVKMPYAFASDFSYDGDRDITVSNFDTGLGNTFDFSTGDGTLYVDSPYFIYFNKSSKINIHLTDKGGAKLDSNAFDAARIFAATIQVLLLQSSGQSLVSKLKPEDFIKFRNLPHPLGSMNSSSSSSQIASQLKTFIGQVSPVLNEVSSKYTDPDTVKIFTKVKTSIPLVNSMASVMEKTSLTAGMDSATLLKSTVDGLKPLVKLAGNVTLDGTIKVDNTTPLAAKMLYKILDCSGTTEAQNAIFSADGLKVFGQNGNNDIESADVAMLVIPGEKESDGSFTFLLTLRDIGMGGSPFLARSSTPSFLGASSGGPVDHFVGSLYTGVSLDANAQTFKMGNMMMSASSDSLNRLDNFVGFSYQNTPSQTFGMYAKYNLAQKAQIDNFAVYTMSSAKGFRVFNTLSYAGLNDKNEGLLLSSQSQTLVLKSQVSHDFTVSNLTFTPKVFAGYGQLLSHNVTKDFEKFDVSTDTSSVFMGAGFGVASGFKVAGVPVHAFGSMEVSCDALQRNTRIGANQYAVSDSNKSLSLVVKADLSKESSLYTTTKLQDNNAQISHGFEIGLNVKI